MGQEPRKLGFLILYIFHYILYSACALHSVSLKFDKTDQGFFCLVLFSIDMRRKSQQPALIKMKYYYELSWPILIFI